jgi:hypothetical protein
MLLPEVSGLRQYGQVAAQARREKLLLVELCVACTKSIRVPDGERVIHVVMVVVRDAACNELVIFLGHGYLQSSFTG